MSTTFKDTNPKDAVGIAKVPASTVPREVLAEVGLAMMEGALKYGRHNYREAGVRASVYFDAASRHLDAFYEGQDIDPDSGLPHIVKAIACLVVLRDSQFRDNWVDDRPPKLPDNWQADLNAKAAALLEKYPNPVPAHTEVKPFAKGGPVVGPIFPPYIPFPPFAPALITSPFADTSGYTINEHGFSQGFLESLNKNGMDLLGTLVDEEGDLTFSHSPSTSVSVINGIDSAWMARQKMPYPYPKPTAPTIAEVIEADADVDVTIGATEGTTWSTEPGVVVEDPKTANSEDLRNQAWTRAYEWKCMTRIYHFIKNGPCPGSTNTGWYYLDTGATGSGEWTWSAVNNIGGNSGDKYKRTTQTP